MIIHLEQKKQLIIKQFRQNPLHITNDNIHNYPEEFSNIHENLDREKREREREREKERERVSE
jgi:hypothetical protein